MYSRDEVFKSTLEYFSGDELATNVFINKYCLKDSSGNLYEKTPDDMHHRLAKEFSRIERDYNNIWEIKTKDDLSEYGKKRELLNEDKIFNYFKNFKYIIPGGSIMSSLGDNNTISSLSNCIVIPELYDSYSGIFFADQQMAQLMKRRCGVGLDISNLRPSQSSVSNSAKSSTGGVSFMERFSNTTREVAQDGRRGALMITMDIQYIDIEDFIFIKKDLKKVTGANISIKITDDFMNAVENDKEYTLQWPVRTDNPKYTKKIKAKELWNKIIDAAYNSAEPGLIFWDTQHDYSTSSNYPNYKNISTNPCSEIAMGNDSCRLTSLNMFSFVINPFKENPYFDFDKWYEITYEAQRLMDDIVDLELESIDKILNKIKLDSEPNYIKDVEIRTWKSLYENGKKGRRTGLGFTGLADALAALNLKYDSQEALDIVKKIMIKKCEAEFESSIDMAIERGKFNDFDIEIENKSKFIENLKENFNYIYNKMLKYGRRNISISTVAPSGTISILAQTSSGIEPVFKPTYKRRRKINPNDKNSKINFVDKLGDSWEEYEVVHPKLQTFINLTNKKFEESPYYKCSAHDIDWKFRIKMQSIVQQYITHSISSCVTKDTLITTEKGLYYIDELCDFSNIKENEFMKNYKDIKIINHKNEFTDINSFYNNGVKPIYEIILDNNLYLNCTGNEKFLVYNEELDIDEWKMLSEINEGDLIKISQH